MAYYLIDENGKKVETTLDVLKAKSKALHDQYYSKYGDTWQEQTAQGFSAIENADPSIQPESMQLIGYYDNAPIYSSGGVGSGTGTFINGEPYFGTYFQLDEKGNLEQGELSKYNEHWYDRLLENIPKAGAIGMASYINPLAGAGVAAAISGAESAVGDVPLGEALKRAAISAAATYAGGKAIGALGDYASGAGGTGALSEEAFWLAESEGVSAYNSALAQGLGEEAAQAAYTDTFNSTVSGVASGGADSDNLSGGASEGQLTNTSEGTDVGTEPLTGSLDSDQSYTDMLNEIAGTEVSESTWNALPASTTGGISWLDAIKAGLILAPVIAGATASTGDTTASSTTTTNTLPAYTQPTAEKLFFDFIDDFYGTGTSGKSTQERITEDTDYLNNLSTNYVSDSKNAVSGYQSLLSDVLNQANTGTGYYTPVSFGFGGKKMASFVPKANRETVDQILSTGLTQAGVNQGLVDLGYNEAKTTTPNEAANSYSKTLEDLMTKLIGGTSTATTTGTVDNSSQTLTNILSGANTAAKLLEALTKWSSTST